MPEEVFVTRTGTCWHRFIHGGQRKANHEVEWLTIEEAEHRGFVDCSVCVRYQPTPRPEEEP